MAEKNQMFDANSVVVSRLDKDHTRIRFFSKPDGFKPKETVVVNYWGSKEQLIQELEKNG
jgi:hypothetical protein